MAKRQEIPVAGPVSEAIAQADVWSRAARRQAEAISRSTAAVEAVAMIWGKLDEETKARIEEDTLIRERLRHAMGYYGYNCS